MTTTPSHILDFWIAYDRVEPLAYPWQQTAFLCAQIEKLVAIENAKMKNEKYEQSFWFDFMPVHWERPKTNLGPAQSEAEQEKVIRSIAKK